MHHQAVSCSRREFKHVVVRLGLLNQVVLATAYSLR